MNTETSEENTSPEDLKGRKVSRVDEGEKRQLDQPLKGELRSNDKEQIQLAGAKKQSEQKLVSSSSKVAEGKKATKEGDDDVTMTFPQRVRASL